MILKLATYDDPVAFLEHAGEFLLEHEVEHNLIVGLAFSLKNQVSYGDAPPYMAVVESADGILGAALRTPPRDLIVSRMADDAALDRIVAHVRDCFGGRLPGVIGLKAVAASFAEKWTAATGQSVRPGMSMCIYRLDAVTPPPGVPGTLRGVTTDDRERVINWMINFTEDIGHHGDRRADAEAAAQRYLTSTSATRALFFWEVDGEPVAMAGTAGPTPGSLRIGAVYTPPEQRKRGYGSAVTAAVSQHVLDSGRQFCTLFTDLSNPTSNHIYQEIGYRPVCDVDEYKFADPV